MDFAERARASCMSTRLGAGAGARRLVRSRPRGAASSAGQAFGQAYLLAVDRGPGSYWA